MSALLLALHTGLRTKVTHTSFLFFFVLYDDDDDVGLYVLGCRVDILGTNCTKLLKVKMSGGGGGVGGVRESLWLQYV